MARKQNTTKKVKVVGHVEYVNQATGLRLNRKPKNETCVLDFG